MINIRKLKAGLVVFMIMALVLTPFTGNAAAIEQIPINNATSISMNESLQESSELKINSDVKEKFHGERYIEVLVSMKEKADTLKVARETEAALKAKTPYEKKMGRRSAVVDKLQRTAEKTQEKILKLLEAEKRKGNVQEYRSFYIVNMVYVKATEDVINKISKYSEVAEIGLNKKIQVEWPEVAEVSVDEIGTQSIEWGIDKVGAPAVWSGFGINGSGVVVGLIDTGFDYTHEALMTKWRGYNPADPSSPNPAGNWYDAVDGKSLPYDIPSIPHGTHVMGTILGQDPAGVNKIGVAPGAQFIGAKAFTESGGYDYWLLAAGEWMLAPGGDPSKAPDIINNSWGGDGGLNEWYREMVQAWRAAGIFPVFSAGNAEGAAAPGSVSVPANYPESFAVGATDINDLRGDFSKLGPSPYAAPDDLKPDISAPGVSIRSSVPGGYEAGWSGTSMASPHISGTAALLLSFNSALTPDQIEQIITGTATPLTDADYSTAPNYGYGYGLVNAFNAVSSIVSGIGTIQGKVLEPGIDAEPGLPLDAVVTVLETGRSVRTNPADGSYKIAHAAATEGQSWTLRAESYGFIPQEKNTTLENGQTITMDFVMGEKPKGSISGQVVDERTDGPIPDAVVQIIEDYHIQPVTTDANGYYQMPEIYEGQYTLRVRAVNYTTAQLPVNITGGVNSEVNVQLKPFIGSVGELIYDDGSVDNARAFYDAGTGWVVRMTPNDLCQVKGARAYFWSEDWPVPGGDRIAVSIFDSNANGAPDKEIFRTEPLTIVRGQWNDIDLSSYSFTTDKDFYMMVIQLDPSPNVPGMGLDETSSSGRSYAYIDGGFRQLGDEYGNIMLRAKVAYELTSPVITSPVDGTFTTSDNVDVKGIAGNDSLVKVYVNNQAAGEAQSVDNAFTINVPLTEGENIINATATIATGETDPSEPVTVVKDTAVPVLEVNAPAEGFVTNREVVDVSGRVIDNYLAKLIVNGNEVLPQQDGSFNTSVIVVNGINVITVEAIDKAGNTTKIERTVNAGLTMPTIADIMPGTDLTVRAGDKVTVSFRSDAIHGDAFFTILGSMLSNSLQTTGYRMNEAADGYYVGEWTVPENLNITNAVVEVQITNVSGNTSIAEANGTITVIMDKTPPVLIPDTLGNTVGQDVAITFENNTEWINAISDVQVNGQSAAGSYTVEPGRITIEGSLFGTKGDYQIAVVANEYKDAAVTQKVTLLIPPELTSSVNKRQVILTFTDNAAWRSAITDITVNGQSASGLYTVSKGKITIGTNAFPSSGSYTIAVKGNGYEDAVVVRIITLSK